MNSPVHIERTLVSAFLENVPYSVYFKDRDSRFIAVSASMLRHSGISRREELIGKTDFEVFSGAHAGIAFADEQRIIRTGEPVVGKLEREDWSDGRVTWVLSTKLPLRDAAGKIVGTFGISKDVTAARAAEASLEEARKELTDASRLAGMAEVATGVLHNVGNVLNSLNVSASIISSSLRSSKTPALAKISDLVREHSPHLGEFLTRDPKGSLIPGFLSSLAQHLSEERSRLLAEVEVLRTNIDHIKDIVATQQAYATTAGVVEPLSGATLMDDALRMNGPAFDRRSIVLERVYQPAPLAVAERGKVLQILINLIRNAKYAVDSSTAAERRITVRVSATPENCVRLVVEDNGIGIPAENLTRIFGHGFTTRPGGHGFGLHSSALAAAEMGGTLKAHSDGPGRGASFTLELPAAAAGEKAA